MSSRNSRIHGLSELDMLNQRKLARHLVVRVSDHALCGSVDRMYSTTVEGLSERY